MTTRAQRAAQYRVGLYVAVPVTGDVLALLAWPVFLIAVAFGLPSLPALLVPRSWRRRWRHRHDRPAIRVALRRAVFAADRYRCVRCKSGFALQLDHVFPWSLGGLSSLWNLVTLCGRCNQVKSNYWAYPSGTVIYRPFTGAGDIAEAAAILAAEQRARLNPLRWWRAAWWL